MTELVLNPDYIKLLREEMRKELPGQEAQMRMAPGVRLPGKKRAVIKKAGVLILLYPIEQSLYTVFIRRTKYLGIHSGQISLPGGKMEKTDSDIAVTALRETEEEIGINSSDIIIIGYLSQLLIPVSNSLVYPVVGFIPYRPVFKPDLNEVEGVIETPVDEFLQPEVVQNKIENIMSRKVHVPFYNISGNHIWGATAMIISEFTELLQRIKSDR